MKKILLSLCLIFALALPAMSLDLYGYEGSSYNGIDAQLINVSPNSYLIKQGNGSMKFTVIATEHETMDDGQNLTIVKMKSAEKWTATFITSAQKNTKVLILIANDGKRYNFGNTKLVIQSPSPSSYYNPYTPSYNTGETLEQMNARFKREDSKLTCSACNGCGRCPVCHGSGRYTSYGYTQEPCSGCGGDGKCFHCHGSGKLYN